MAKLNGDSNEPGKPAIFGIHNNPNPGDASIIGQSNTHGRGVLGISEAAQGVWGVSGTDTGVVGESRTGTGIIGTSTKTEPFEPHGIGVHGTSTAAGSLGIGVLGEGGSTGVLGRSTHFDGHGVTAESGGRASALLVDNTGEFSAALIRQFGSGSLIVCRTQQNFTVFQVRNNGDVHATGDVNSRGVKLTCDRNAKANLTDVDAREVLETLAGMPIQNWNYKSDPTGVRHIGPTSQDFQAAFGLNGDDDIHISAVDAQGIALAAIQGLNEKLQAENAELRTNLASLEDRFAALESMAQRPAEPSPA